MKEYFAEKEKEKKRGKMKGRVNGRGERRKKKKNKRRRKKIFFHLPPKPENLFLEAVWHKNLEWNRPC